MHLVHLLDAAAFIILFCLHVYLFECWLSVSVAEVRFSSASVE